MVDGEIVIAGRYPTNEEFTKLLDLSRRPVLGKQRKPVTVKVAKKKSGGC